MMGPLVLVAPLDWGLGHATRCIPVIYALIKQGFRVLIAADGKVKHLLSDEFPQVPILHIRNYGIRYTSSAWALPFGLIIQIPKLLSIIQYENRILRKYVRQYGIDAVISDNRYGFYHPGVPSVILTHQLHINTPFGEIGDRFLQQLNYRFINRFSECWVPDHALPPALAGTLSHPRQLPRVQVKYTGPLSRFNNGSYHSEEKHLLLLLSGPEPQRTILEKMLLAEIAQYRKPVVLVRGIPGATENLDPADHVTVYNYLPARELEAVISEAQMIICRSGYSTVMDLARLRKKSILIPTPGQTEQEYLGRHLSSVGFALVIPQDKFRLQSALALAADFAYNLPQETESSALEEAVRALAGRLQ